MKNHTIALTKLVTKKITRKIFMFSSFFLVSICLVFSIFGLLSARDVPSFSADAFISYSYQNINKNNIRQIANIDIYIQDQTASAIAYRLKINNKLHIIYKI